MVEPITNPAPQDPLSEFMAARQQVLMTGPEWSALQVLDAVREQLGGFFGMLNEHEKHEYVRLQRAWIDAQKTFEQAIHALTATFRQQAQASLRVGLRTLTGQDIDPGVARIHTRYAQAPGRVQRAADSEVERGATIKVASLTLWDAACMNYDGLTGWSYPGHTGLADASYLDTEVNTTVGQFIALVRKLNIGGQLKKHLDQALQANGSLARSLSEMASAEFEFALIEALKNTTTSRVDREKYQQVRRALVGEVPWDRVEEMLLFIPHGLDNISWIPEPTGFLGQSKTFPPGDSLSVPHIVFSVSGSPGAFSFFPNRPGGSLRYHDSFREACHEFYVAFDAFYRRGAVDWLYQSMLLCDCARLKQISATTPPPQDLNAFAQLIYALAQAIPKTDKVSKIGYVRTVVKKVPVVSLNDFYIKRSRANLQELANKTSGFMPTLLELFETVISEILNVLLIPVPGALKGLGRVRAFAMFVAMERALIDGGSQALQGQPEELLQGFADLADLLVSGRLHTRLAKSVQRRHQRLYRQLFRQRTSVCAPAPTTSAALLERMLGVRDTPARDLEVVLQSSGTSLPTLNQVWAGVPPSASLVDAVHRFKADRLIGWVVEGADPSRPAPVDAVHVMAPLLTQLEDWPVGTALSIENHQGVEVRRYSKESTRPTTDVVTVTMLENHQLGYATPRRLAAHLPEALVAMLPTIFQGGERQIRQQLATLATALKIDLFDALTGFAESSRAAANGAGASVRKLLPDRVRHELPVPAVIAQLQTLHPQLSLDRLLEVLREHPLSAHQQTQLLDSQLQPEGLFNALRAARRTAGREAIVDGLFHPRRFDRQTQNWAAEFAGGVLRNLTGQGLVVSPAAQAVPYVLRGPADRTMAVIDQDLGRFAAYNLRESRPGPRLTGADSFYAAIVSQISELDLSVAGLTAQQAITEFRYQVAQALLRNRAPDGSFYPRQRDIAQYAHTVDTPGIAAEPDALGRYHQGEERFLFVEGEYFKISQASPSQPWRVAHPSLHDAYAPVLTHNGAGAWRHEWENPLTWDGQKPFYRLGPLARSLSPDAIEQIAQISGVTPAILRRVHVRNEQPPGILVETVERFTIHQRLKVQMAGMEAVEGTAAGRDFLDQLLGEIGPERADALVGRSGASRADQVTVLESRVMLDKPQMERLFFKALCHKSERSSDPLAQVLQRDFPSLTARTAEDLVRNITTLERRSLESGRVPLTLTNNIRWWVEYLRKIRAMEGLHLTAATSEGSARLILHTLPDIEGWPAHLRVEVWERGRLIDSIGPVDGALKRLLESLSGQYQAYLPGMNGGRLPAGNPGPFLSVLLDALPPAERQALGYTHASGPNELLREISLREEHKWELAQTLRAIGRRPRYNPPRRVADGRIGYPLSGEGTLGAQDRRQVARLRQLFPSKTDEQAFEILNNLSDSPHEREDAINLLFREQEALDATLDRWCLLGKPGNLATQLEAAERIRRCWHKEDSTRGIHYELNLDDLSLEDLPQMSAYFAHVRVLSFKGNQLTQISPSFFRGFPDLRWLFLSGNRLAHLPVGLTELNSLSLLDLANNRIQPDLSDVMYLAKLTGLVKLNLSGNPLGDGATLKLYSLRRLRVLMLRDAGLTRLPSGSVALRDLQVFDVRHNQIRTLGEHDLYVNENVHRALDLGGNDLSQDTYELLASYRRRPGYHNVDFGLSAPPVPLPFIDRWLPPMPLDEVPLRRAAWACLGAEQMAGRFFNVLGNISAYGPLTAPEYQALRTDLTQRVWDLIDAALSNPRLRQILFDSALAYRTGGIDGWLLCLNDLELQMLPVQMLAANVDTAGPDFVNYFRALRRLNSIHLHLARALPGLTDRELCTRILAYRIGLAPTLALPLALPGRFDAPTAMPSPESVNELRRRILNEEAGFNWPQQLEAQECWVEFLERKYARRFNATLKQYHRALELATEKVGNGGMNEGAYKTYIEVLGVPMRKAKADLISELTLKEWSAFIIG